MEVTLTRGEGNSATLSVTVPAQDVDAVFADVYREAGERMKVDGFRQGKVPRSVIDAQVGREQIVTDVSGRLGRTSSSEAIARERLLLINEPKVLLAEPAAEGEPYTFSVAVELRPELGLSDYRDIVVTLPPEEVAEDDVDAAVTAFREHLATFEVAEGRAVEREDMIVMSITSAVTGVADSEEQYADQVYELGKGHMPGEFDEALLGRVAGDKAHIEVSLPGKGPKSDDEPATAMFDVAIHEVRAKVVPELTEKLLGTMGYDSLDALRAEFRSRLQAERGRLREQMRHVGAVRELAARLEGEVPEAMVKQRLGESIRGFAQQLKGRGMALEQFCMQNGITPDQLVDDMRVSAQRDVQAELALEALFRDLGLEVDQKHIDLLLTELAATTQTSMDEQRAQWDGPMGPWMELAVRVRMATDWLLENATFQTMEDAGADDAQPGVAGDGEPETIL